jgi:IS5 family transposase
VINLHRGPLGIADDWIAEQVDGLWEDWMLVVDQVLADPHLLQLVYEVLARRWTHSRTRGRKGTPAEVVLRLLLLKHMRNWSYAVLEREVRANLVYRQFTRVGAGKVPDAKTLGKLGVALGPEIIEQLHQRVVAIAQEHQIVQGRRMRVDTTVVETNIHYPTDASLLGDGVRVLTRTMKKIERLAGAAGAKLRNRMRSTQRCLVHIGRASRSFRTAQGKDRLRQCYGRLLAITGRVVGQAKRFAREVQGGIKAGTDILTQAAIEAHSGYLQTMIPRVQQVMRNSPTSTVLVPDAAGRHHRLMECVPA